MVDRDDKSLGNEFCFAGGRADKRGRRRCQSCGLLSHTNCFNGPSLVCTKCTGEVGGGAMHGLRIKPYQEKKASELKRAQEPLRPVKIFTPEERAALEAQMRAEGRIR